MPVVIDKTIHIHTRIAAWEIKEQEQDLHSRLILNTEEEAFLQSIKTGKKRLQWLASRCLIRMMANTPEFIAMHTSSKGQPLMTDLPKRVSISHAGTHAAVIMSDNAGVGIDIEEITPKILLIKDKFIGDEEIAWMKGGNTEKHLIVWSAKEALFKWYAKGNVDFRKHLLLKEFTPAESGIIQATFRNELLEKNLEIHYQLFNGCVMTWVAG